MTSCRAGCGACCIAPSISSPIPGMPGGKPAGVRCVQLSDDDRCLLFGKPERPRVCVELSPTEEMCGGSRAEAIRFLNRLERMTQPCLPTPAPEVPFRAGLEPGNDPLPSGIP